MAIVLLAVLDKTQEPIVLERSTRLNLDHDRGNADVGVAGVTGVREEEEEKEKKKEVLTGQSKVVQEVLADLKCNCCMIYIVFPAPCCPHFKGHLWLWNISDGDEMA